MANLPETPNQYPEAIYQIEQDDSVAGGPNGVSNRQATQLGNRTGYLKGKVEAGEAKDAAQDRGIAALTVRVESVENAGSGEAAAQALAYWWR